MAIEPRSRGDRHVLWDQAVGWALAGSMGNTAEQACHNQTRLKFKAHPAAKTVLLPRVTAEEKGTEETGQQERYYDTNEC